jgi:DNA polymerase III alpha subunit (gram-positive type)
MPNALISQPRRMELVIFDLETAGSTPRDNKIIQLAKVRMRHGEMRAAARFETFVRPHLPQ